MCKIFNYQNNSFSTRHAELVSASVGCKDLEFGSIPSKTLKQVQGDGLVVQDDKLLVQDDRLRVDVDALKIDNSKLEVKFNKPSTKLNLPILNSTTPNLLNKNNKPINSYALISMDKIMEKSHLAMHFVQMER